MAQYRLHDPDKGVIGPVHLDTVRDLVKAGVVHDGTFVSRDDGPFLPVQAFEEILPLKQAAVPHEPQPTYSGDLGKNTFFKVFHRFHITGATGLLRVVRGDLHRDIFLEGGRPTFVASNIASERLGEFLVARGKLDRDEHGVALAAMHTDRNRLGYTLIRLGLIEPQELYHELRGQQMARLVDLCTWDSGRYLFFDRLGYHGDKVDLQLNVLDLIIQAARSLPLPRLETRLAGMLNTIVQRQSPPHVESESLKFTAFEQRVVAAIDGRRTLNRLLQDLGADGDHRRAALMVVYLLWEIDAVGFRAA